MQKTRNFVNKFDTAVRRSMRSAWLGLSAVVLAGAVDAGPFDGPEIAGQWTEVVDGEVIAVHMVMLPTGRVLTYEEGGVGRPLLDEIRLFDPKTLTVESPELPPHDLFCSGHSVLPDGRVFIQGGHDEADANGHSRAAIYDPFSDTWQDNIPNMNAGRWYSTNTILPNGDVLVLNGAIDSYTNKNLLPQIWQLQTQSWRNLVSAEEAAPMGIDFYPRMFVAPDGRVFKAGPDRDTWFLDTRGTGQWQRGPDMNWPGFRGYSSSVMFDEGKILVIGGGEQPPTNTVEMIDLNQPNPQWQYVAPMHHARRHLNATLMADGQVLVTGGTSSPGFNSAAQAVTIAEIYNPATNVWTEVAPQAMPRVYHSTAVLLPDARILIGGGGRPAPDAGVDNPNVQIYSPPYLFNGPRPVIDNAPSAVSWGETFNIDMADANAITGVNFIRLGATTHAFNQTQSINQLDFTVTAGGLSITAPNNPNLAPPGQYMLFVLADGVPSEAAIITFGDAELPSAPSGLMQNSVGTTTATVSWLPSVDNTQVVAYQVFVDGEWVQTVNGTNATIDGLFAAQTYDITVAARDLYGNLSLVSEPLTLTTQDPGQNPPVANAGADIVVNPGENFLLDGSASSDVDGQLLTYEWWLNDALVGTTPTLAQSHLAPGVYLYELRISDGDFEVIDYVAATVIEQPNLLPNGQFDGALAPWQTETEAGAVVAYGIEAGAFRATIDAAGPNIWSSQVFQTLNLTAGETYTLTFDVQSDAANRGLSVIVEELGTWEPYANQRVIVAAPMQWQRVTITWQQAVTTDNAKLGFHFGASGVADVWLDNVRLSNGAVPNLPPVAIAGADFEGFAAFPITLNGNQSYDPEQDALTYNWEQLSGPAVTWLTGQGVTRQFETPATGLYQFALVANDGEFDSNQDVVTVNVKNFVNRAPIAVVPVDFWANLGETIVLDGSASYDPDPVGQVLSYAWQQVAGPEVVLTGADSAQPSFSATAVGSYTFVLTVNDGELASTPVELTVSVSEGGVANNILVNGNFEAAIAPWQALVLDTAVANFTAANAANIDVTAAGGNPWSIQLYQPVALQAGTTYTLQFDAKASALPRGYSVVIEHNGDPWTNYQNVALVPTLNWQTVTLTWLQPATDNNVKIGFHLGNRGVNDLALRNVVLVAGGIVATQKPVANAGVDQTMTLGETLTLSGHRSRAPAGETLSYQWQQISGPAVSLLNAQSVSASAMPSVAGTYVFGLQVTSASGESTLDEVTVIARAPNQAPVAVVAPVGEVSLGDTLVLDGSGAFDPDEGPAPLAYFWAQLAGPTVEFDKAAAAPSFVVAEAGAYQFSFVVDDGDESSNVLLIEFEVSDSGNLRPVANAGSDLRVERGATVVLDASGSSDADSGPAPLTFTWQQVNGPAATLSDAQSIAPSFDASSSGTYRFSVTVFDGEQSATDSVDVVVVEPNIAPVANAGWDVTRVVGSVVTLDGTASNDPDHGPEALTYFWQQTAGSDVVLSDTESATPSFTADQVGEYRFTLFVFDGALMSLANDVVITVVEPANQAPFARITGPVTAWVGETVELMGDASYDGDDGPAPLAFLWQVTPLSALTVDGLENDVLSLSANEPGRHVASLVVSDSDRDSRSHSVDAQRSLLITDKAILERFSMARVWQALLDSQGDALQTPADVWESTIASREDCGDFNGFAQADDPTAPAGCSDAGVGVDRFQLAITDSLAYYTPIALVNRFDLAAADGSDCGEYRVAYAGNDMSPRVNFVIFEARMPNLAPELGLEGCRPVVEQWAALSDEWDIAKRAGALEAFFFTGSSEAPAALDAAHFAGEAQGSGAIRLNARVDQVSNWVFMQFAIAQTEACAPTCALTLAQEALTNTPMPTLAEGASNEAAAFQQAVIAALAIPGEGLLAEQISRLSLNLPASTLLGRQHSSLAPSLSVESWADDAFKAQIGDALTAAGSSLSVEQVLARANVMTCAGCHNHSADDLGGAMVLASGTQQVEFLSNALTTTAEGERYVVKAAMTDTLLPERKQLLESYLNTVALTVTFSDRDSDGDGVADRLDTCELTPENAIVDDVGCPIDSDNDGAWDGLDLCADTPAGELADSDGCAPSQKDDDGDGVSNAVDACLTTPPEHVNAINTDGCAPIELDSDNDSVNDALDQCPGTPANTVVDAEGCEIVAWDIQLQAEAFSAMLGIQTEATADVGGGLNVGWLDAGDWLQYALPAAVPATGLYRVTYRVASTAQGQISLQNAGRTQTIATTTLPVTGGWQVWQDVSVVVTLTAGTNALSLAVAQAGFNLNWWRIERLDMGDDDGDGVINGLDLCPGTIAGATVDADGCEVVNYTLTRQAEAFEAMLGVQTEATTDTGGGLNVGWLDTGDWLQYTIPAIPQTRTFRISYRIAAMNGGQIEVVNGTSGAVLGARAVPVTGGWQTWQTITQDITLPAGLTVLRLRVAAPGFNLNWFSVQSLAN